MAPIDLYASHAHYADHLWRIWLALPDELRGQAYSGNGSSWWGDRLPARYRTNRLVLVAGWVDVTRLRGTGARMIYVEHGAGQSYPGDARARMNESYHGARHPAEVVGYLAPSERVAAGWREARPGVPVGVVGCPRLDPWMNQTVEPDRRRTLAITWHWNCLIAPEAKSALPHYRRALPGLIDRWRAQGFQVLGHGHPRAWGQLHRMWDELGVEAVRESNEVLDRAGVLLADNTSLLYEFAALDRPVVVANAPWYRRDVHHGLRFWNLIPGVQVNDADELAGLDLAQHVDLDPFRRDRQIVLQSVYAHRDGTSAARAAEWLAGLQEG